MKLSHLLAIYASAILSGLVCFPPLALAQSAPQVPSYASAFVKDYVSFQLNGGGTNNVLPVSSTILQTSVSAKPMIITSLHAGAITPPSATGDVTIQFFKNTTAAANALCAAYDLNGLTASVMGVIPITSTTNVLFGTNDILICQIVTGASIGGANGLTTTALTRISGR